MCNSHLVFATLQSWIIAARRETTLTAGKDEKKKMEEQTVSRETMEVTTPTGKEDRMVSWGPNEVREYRKGEDEEDNKDLATRRQVEDDVNMVVEEGGNLDEGCEGIPSK